MTNYDLIVIGGGPAGMMAAITAAEHGAKPLVLERNSRLGRKLLITGKGRCNLTNNCSRDELMANIPRNPRFLYSAFSALSPAEVMTFFESRGLPLKTERGNRVFPVSDKAGDVLAVLEKELSRLKVEKAEGRAVQLLLGDGCVQGVICEDGREYRAPAVIVAAGGKSYPQTGSTGDGYLLAVQAGHQIVPPVPSLVPIVTEERDPRDMQGLSLKNVTLTLTQKGKTVFSELGELLFTHFGVSGPLVLSASAHLTGAAPEGEPTEKFYASMLKGTDCRLSIDWKPGLTPEQLDRRLLRDFSQSQNRDIINSLGGLLPKKSIPVLLKRAKIPYEQKVNSLTRDQRQTFIGVLKDFSLTPTGFRPIEEAIITSGGVAVGQINPKTMESKLLPGLYFAGEVLDVNGYTGGFNLQIAFATGRAAGESCAAK